MFARDSEVDCSRVSARSDWLLYSRDIFDLDNRDLNANVRSGGCSPYESP